MIEVFLACYVALSFQVPADWTVTSVENRQNSVLLHMKKTMKEHEEIVVPKGCSGEEPKPQGMIYEPVPMPPYFIRPYGVLQ